jgi:Uma2 family endonuclease
MVVRNAEEPVYPSSDGKPMAENTLQYRWITIIKGGMDVVFRDDPNVFVAGDLFWYPVRFAPEIRTAPDTLVAFGRPKGHRLSYLQWEEEDTPPQVVFEILSPSNTTNEMAAKLFWYEQYGVEEYYVYDPDRQILQGWVREGDTLRGVPGIRNGFTSPRTGVHLEIRGELVLTGPDGRPFLDYPELAEERDAAEERARDAEQRAQTSEERAEKAEERAEKAEERAQTSEERAEKAEERAKQERRARADAEAKIEQERRARADAEALSIAERNARDAAERQSQEVTARLARLEQLLAERGIDPDAAAN